MTKAFVRWIAGWVGLFLVPAVVIYWMSTTSAFQRAFSAYGGALASVCGNQNSALGGACGGLLGLLLPVVTLYALLRVTVFRRDREAAAFVVIYGFILVVIAVNLSH